MNKARQLFAALFCLFFVGALSAQVAAITEVNVTLDEYCQAYLTHEQILTGLDEGDYLGDIIVRDGVCEDGYGECYSATVDGCGRYIWETTVNGTPYWGYVNAEDKTSPQLYYGVYPPDTLLCNEVDLVNINEGVAVSDRCYNVNADGSFRNYGSITDVDDFLEDTELGRRLAAGGGLPTFYDGCSSMEICVTDVKKNAYYEYYEEDDICGGILIHRSFTATDGDCPSVSGEENDPTIYDYYIYFYTPNIYDTVDPYYWAYENGEAEFSCADYSKDDPNPAPELEDFPYLNDGVGGYERTYIDDAFCTLGTTWSDGPRVMTCDDTYKFVRTFTVFDWCSPGYTHTYTQVVKVGDFEGPELTLPTQDRDFDGEPDEGALIYSTNSLDCSAYFVIPAGSAEDDCDDNPTVTAVVYPFGDEYALPIGPFAVGELAGPFPTTTGNDPHVLVYTAVDACGNKTSDYVEFEVVDQTAPVAICEDGLNISIGGTGVAIISAEDIDRASYDECGGVTLAIACVDDENVAIPDDGDAGDDPDDGPEVYYDPTLPVDCDDLGVKRISLRVTDNAGNVNYCWLDVLIEDKAAPICVPPASDKIVCTDLAGDFPEDLNDLFEADPEGTAALLDAQFGEANGVDNCEVVAITQTVEDKRNSCGKGEIIRDFVVEDAQGLTSGGTCRQVITVELVHDYTIVLPGDVGSDDCVEDDYMGVTFDERGCDLITIYTKIDTFTATADECYKLRITYEILNWCEYNGETDPYVIPRDADDDNDLDEATYLHVEPNDEDDLSDDTAELDRDNDPSNNFETGDKSFIDFLDAQDGGLVDGNDDDEGYGDDGSRGAFLYRQFIKVYDDKAPTLEVADVEVCDDDGDCAEEFTTTITVGDDCSPASISVTAELDAFRVDANEDGTFTLAEFVDDGPAGALTVTNNGDGTVTISSVPLPFGNHAVRVHATDGCGNTAVTLFLLDIEDCKAPTPICINGLTATLMPDGEGGGMAAIWANDFIASPSTDCSGEVKFAIYRSDSAAADTFEGPSVLDTGLLLDCADLGMLPVRIYAIDAEGNADYCETTLFVQAFQETVCENAGGAGSLAGAIATANNIAMNNVEVNITDDNTMSASTSTANGGFYTFTSLEQGADYTVQPAYDASVNLSNVSTGDLILISRHILGISSLEGEYQRLAADVTQDENINVLDIISIRRVILGLDNGFSATASYRFYTNEGAEVFNVNNLSGAVTGADFVAVEMGNVSDAIAGAQAATSRGTASIDLSDVSYAAGESFTVELQAADLAGFQATLELATGLELTNATATNAQAAGFNLDNAAAGLVAVSNAGAEAITLELRATTDGRLSQALSLSDRITTTEGYTANGGVTALSLNFVDAAGAEFALEQNTPNPFAERTVIGFQLPQAGEVSLTVQDVQGRVVLTRTLEGAAGYNRAELTTADMKGATGVMSYTIVAGDFTATRKMVVVR